MCRFLQRHSHLTSTYEHVTAIFKTKIKIGLQLTFVMWGHHKFIQYTNSTDLVYKTSTR